MTDTVRRSLLAAAGASATLAAAPSAFAQGAAGYPNRTIKIVVGFAPGGLTDAYARMFAEQITARYNQPCVVENRPGAGANIAIDAVVVPEKLGVKTWDELVAWCRKNPGTMGSYAPASSPHILAETLNKQFGANLQTVHYKGEGPMWVDMAAGQLQVAVGSYQAAATVLNKGFRAIAATGAARCPKLPDVATLQEQGLKAPIALLEGGLAFTVRSGTPIEIIEMLSKVAIDGNDTPRAKALRENFAIPTATGGRAEALKMWKENAPLWIKEVEALGVKLD